jgi:hypothetical protein
MIAKRPLIAEVFGGHAGCAALAIKKQKSACFFFLVIF